MFRRDFDVVNLVLKLTKLIANLRRDDVLQSNVARHLRRVESFDLDDRHPRRQLKCTPRMASTFHCVHLVMSDISIWRT